MKNRVLLLLPALLLFTTSVNAQVMGLDIKGLNATLDKLYTDMLPQCSALINAGRAIGAFGALFYISNRIFRHLVNAEPIDFYPLFRPFAIGMAIALFPSVLGLINGLMSPVVQGTSAMVLDSDKTIAILLKKRDDAVKKSDAYQVYVGENGGGDQRRWEKYTNQPESTTGFGDLKENVKFTMDKMSYNFRNSIKQWLSELLTLFYLAAGLCINAVRTFFLLVLAIIGPIAFGISIFDGFQQSLSGWLTKYLNIFLWLPVANILGSVLGKIQQGMIQLDTNQIKDTGDTFFSQADTAYLIFLIIGIVAFLCVPSFTNTIIQASGGNALTQRMTSLAMSTTNSTAGMAGSAAGVAAGGIAGGAKMVGSGAMTAGKAVIGKAAEAAGNLVSRLKGN